jgi:WD40 repeat protein
MASSSSPNAYRKAMKVSLCLLAEAEAGNYGFCFVHSATCLDFLLRHATDATSIHNAVSNSDDASMQAIRAYKAHAAPVVAVAWRPKSDHHVVSASLDGTVKLWDSRSALPLATLEDAAGSRLSAVVWGSRGKEGGGALFVAAGGEDAVLRQYDVPELGARVEE